MVAISSHYMKSESMEENNMNTLQNVEKPKNKFKMRYVILALVFVNIVINYMDRTNVSIAMPELEKEIGL